MIEVLLAMGILTFVAGIGATLLRAPLKMVKVVSDRLESSTLADVGEKELVERFSRTYVMRRGFFDCGADYLEDSLAGPSSSRLPDGFTVAHSTFSSIGAVPVGETAVIRVTDIRQFPVGAMVLVTLINQPAIGGVFLIQDNDADESTITLSTGAIVIPDDFTCAIQNSNTLVDILGDGANLVGGQAARTLRLDVVQLTRYWVVASPPPKLRVLMEQTWPAPSFPNRVREKITLERFQTLDIASTWTPDDGSDGVNGVFLGELTIARLSESMLEGAKARDLASVQVRKRVGYTTATGGVVNSGVTTAPQSAKLAFPTCSISALPASDVVFRDDNEFAQMFRIEGHVVGAPNVARIDISFSAPGDPTDPKPTCWQSDQVLIDNLKRLVVPGDQGITEAAAIGPSASGGLTSLICAVRPATTFQGVLQYFDAKNNFVVRRPCSSVTTSPDPLAFVYQGAATSCDESSRSVTFGQLIVQGSNPVQPGPSLFLGSESCRWENTGSAFIDCTPIPSRGALMQISILPKAIPWGTPAGSQEIDCD